MTDSKSLADVLLAAASPTWRWYGYETSWVEIDGEDHDQQAGDNKRRNLRPNRKAKNSSQSL